MDATKFTLSPHFAPPRGVTIGPAKPTEWYHPSIGSSLDRVRFWNVATRNWGVFSDFFGTSFLAGGNNGLQKVCWLK